jgi:hypothetical protein
MNKCQLCHSEVPEPKTWWCSQCHTATFCEPCYNIPGKMQSYRCQEIGDGKQCDGCFQKHGPTYCIDEDCTCDNGPPPPLTKREIRRAQYKKRFNL